MHNGLLVKAIKNYILEDGAVTEEGRMEIVNELRRYKKDFHMFKDYNYYSYGNILPYYSQIREFYEKNGLTPYTDDDMLLEHFKLHIRKAIDSILEEC